MDKEETEEETPMKKSKMPLVIGLILALIGGGGGYFAVQSGMIFGTPSQEHNEQSDPHTPALPKITFVEVDPLVVNLKGNGKDRVLRFRVQLEVDGPQEAEVISLMPRIVDVMNGYLRAVSIADLEAPSALIKLRSQLLRRIQIVTGEERVRDLLVMEFVIN